MTVAPEAVGKPVGLVPNASGVASAGELNAEGCTTDARGVAGVARPNAGFEVDGSPKLGFDAPGAGNENPGDAPKVPRPEPNSVKQE